MADKGRRMIFEDEYQYLKDLKKDHPDPSASWGGGGGGGEYTAGTGIIIDDNEISLDTTPDIFEITADTGMTLEVENSNPLWKDSKLQMTYTGSTRLEGTQISLEANNIYLNSDYAPYYVNNTTHDYKTLATTDQLFSGNYNDLTNKPTIPDAVSGTNDGTNWTSLTIGNDTYGLASGGTTYTAGTGINITGSTISVDTSVIAEVSDIPTNVSDLNNDAGYITGINSSDVVTALGYTPTNPSSLATVATTGDYDDLINKPTIPTNYVTTDTTQTITGVKTFEGAQLVRFKEATSGDTLGFTSYDTSGNELGNLQTKTRELTIANGEGSVLSPVTRPLTTIGDYSTSKTGYAGLRVRTTSGTNRQINFVAPHMTYRQSEDVYDKNYDTFFIPMCLTKGNYKLLADNTGKIDISSFLPKKTSDLTNDSGFITGINSSDVTTALGYTPSVVTGTNDGTNWTALTVDGATYNIPSGGSTPSNMVTTDTAQTITARKTIVGASEGLYVQSGATYTSSDTMILPGEINTGTVSGTLIASNTFAVPDVTTAGNGQIRVRDFTQTPFVDYRIEVPTKNGTMALTSDIITSYNDLTNKPDLSIYAQSANLATVATSGSYNDLSNKPTIPTVDYPVTDVQVNGTSVVTNKVANLTDALYYKNGDTYENRNYYQLYGYATNGGKDLQFTVTFNKSLANISSVTVNKITIITRGVAGYVGATSYTDYAADTTNYTVSALISSDNAITITIRGTAAWGNVTNNTPVCAVVQNVVGALKLTFNT